MFIHKVMDSSVMRETIEIKSKDSQKQFDNNKSKMSNNFSVERILSENTQSVNHQSITSEFSSLGKVVDRKRRILEKSIKDITNSDTTKYPRISSISSQENQKFNWQCKLKNNRKIGHFKASQLITLVCITILFNFYFLDTQSSQDNINSKDNESSVSNSSPSTAESFVRRQALAASIVSSDPSPSVLISPRSPERSTITPDTTKEVIENSDYDVEDESISVDDNGDAEDQTEPNKDAAKETADIPKELPCSPGSITKEGITVELVGQHLWKKFHKLGTEMIITKAGR